MAITYTDNGGGAANGSDLEFTFTFPVIQTEDVKVALNAVVQATTKYTVNLSTNPTKITFNNTSIDSNVQETSGAPKSGVTVRVFRQTTVGKNSGDEDPKAVFAAGSSIRAADLNANVEQSLYAIHELQDQPITDTDIEDGVITSAKIADGTIANVDVSATAAIAGTKISPDFGSQNIATTGTVDGRDVSVDGTKLDTIETNAKDDQTASEIKTLYEGNSNTNAYTDAEKTKLSGIETAATADQTAAEIRTLVENASDSNVFTDADHTKLNGIEASATADQTIGEIKTLIAGSPLDASHLAANSVTTSEIADAELTTLASMQSGTASVLASGTALTSTTTELNQLDGKTLGETSLTTNSDVAIPTSKAVADFVSATVAPLGGLEVIANEVSFPNSQPAAGVVISISDAGGTVFNGSGVSTTGRTVGGSTVTINGAPSSLNGETLVSGVGLMVSSTGSSQTYNYHKILGKEDDIKQLSDDINDFNARYRVGSTNPTSALDSGDMFFNTSTGKMLVYNGVNSAWEEVQSIGNFFISTFSESLDGSRTAFTVSNAPTNAQQLIISINGVIQKPNSGTGQPTEGFTLSGSTVTFSSAPANGSSYFVVVLGSAVNQGIPTNNSVTEAILQSNVVSEEKLKVSNSPTNGYYLQAQSGNSGGLTWAAVPNPDLTQLSASNLTSGTIPDARFPATLPAADGSNLTGLASTTAGGAIYENSQTISASHTIPSGSNGMSAGPVTVNNGITLTISTGSTYTIV